jgi:hypothetical protein
MGEAKRRGTFNERVAAAVAKREAAEKREAEWNEKQAERRRVRLEEEAKAEALRPKRSQEPVSRNNRLLYAAAMGLAASSMIGMK